MINAVYGVEVGMRTKALSTALEDPVLTKYFGDETYVVSWRARCLDGRKEPRFSNFLL